MKIEIQKKDIIWSYIGTFSSISSSFLILPFVLHFLSGAEVGIWYIFLSVNGLVSLFDFGFDPTFGRNIAYAWGGAENLRKTGINVYENGNSKNIHLIHVLVESSKKIYRLIAVFAFVTVSLIGTVYIFFVGKNINLYFLSISWTIFCLSILVNLYLGYYSALLRGIGAIAGVNIATFFSKISQLMFSVIGLILGFNLIAVALGFLLNGIIFRIICRRKFIKSGLIDSSDWNIKIEKKEVEEVIRIISFNAFRDGMVAISNYLVTQSASIIASFFLSLTQTGIYSVSLQFATAISNISASMIYACHPAFQSAYILNDLHKQREIISKGLSILYFYSFIGTILVPTIIFPILKIFKHGYNFDISIFIALSVYMLLWQQQSAAASYISDTNEVPYVRSFLISGFLSVLLTILIFNLTSLGVWSLILGPGIVQICYNNWKWIHLVMNRMDTTLLEVLKNGFKLLILQIVDFSKGR